VAVRAATALRSLTIGSSRPPVKGTGARRRERRGGVTSDKARGPGCRVCLRKGELFGLKKEDVDFDLRLIFARHSYDRDTTKGGHEEALPMAKELIPYLKEAVRRSPSALVFPRADGEMYPETTKLEDVLRRALRRAGIILGYRHKCRKQGCGYVEAATDANLRKCPKDQHTMWVTSVVRPIRFHDLRHTTGSLLAMEGADLPAVQKIMRHKDPRITSETYLHLDPRYLREQIDRLHFGAHDGDTKEPSSEPAVAALSGPLVSIVCLDPARPVGGPSTEASDPAAFQPLTAERDIGFEPTTFSLGS
jgi:hypothetical protein